MSFGRISFIKPIEKMSPPLDKDIIKISNLSKEYLILALVPSI